MPLGEGAKLGADAVVPVAEMKEILGDRIVVDADPEHRSGPRARRVRARRPRPGAQGRLHWRRHREFLRAVQPDSGSPPRATFGPAWPAPRG